MVEAGAINLNTAKEAVFPAVLAGTGAPADIVRRRGLGQVSDRGAIEAASPGGPGRQPRARWPSTAAARRASRAFSSAR